MKDHDQNRNFNDSDQYDNLVNLPQDDFFIENSSNDDAYFEEINSFSEDYDKNEFEDVFSKGNKRAFKRAKRKEKKRLKRCGRSNRMLFKLAWISMVVVVSFIFSQYIMTGVKDMLAMNRLDSTTAQISLTNGDTVSKISGTLKELNVIKNESFFRMYSSIFKPSLKFSTGVFDIPKNLEYEEILSYMQTKKNRTDLIDITFTEGLTILECGDLLETNGICKKDDFLAKCNSSEFDSKYGFLTNITNSSERYYKLEGYIYPDTYKFYKDTDSEEVIKKCLKNFEDKIMGVKKMTGYDKATSIAEIAQNDDMSVDELMTLASMVQSEAADVDDMKIIASIFINRLNAPDEKGFWYLNSDPTMYYPYKSATVPKGFESRYNTYKIKGLPPGPVCNPGMDAINAVLSPAKTNYYYFCHDEDGNAYYARTEAGHEENLVEAGLRDE